MTTEPPTHRQIRGIGVGAGTAVARAVIWSEPVGPSDSDAAPNSEMEIKKFDAAVRYVANTLREQAETAPEPLDEILNASAVMAEDSTLRNRVVELVGSGAGASAAAREAFDEFVATFKKAGGLLAQRATDLLALRNRVISRIEGGTQQQIGRFDSPVIIIAQDLAPADTAVIDLSQVAGIITESGGATSHTAIIANQLGIPCLVGAQDALEIPVGALVGLNSTAGIAWVDPSPQQVEVLRTQHRILQSLFDGDTTAATKDGHRIELLANIGSVSDAKRAAQAGVEGIGLLRTEFLFLNRTQPPTEEEQVEIYESIASEFPKRKIVIRTLDGGSDKPLRFVDLHPEINPALGMRGARIYRRESNLIREQLAALAQLPDRDKTWVMAPMITTRSEARNFAEQARAAGIDNVGVMIETPAAALQARQIFTEVDFASLGTNDLLQYTMAADRLNSNVAELLNHWQPAHLALVEQVAGAAIDARKPLGVCGEAAADPLFALVATGLGVSSLSMAINSIPLVGFVLNDHSLDDCRAMAMAALEATDPREARDAVQNLLNEDSIEMLGL